MGRRHGGKHIPDARMNNGVREPGRKELPWQRRDGMRRRPSGVQAKRNN